MTRNYFTYSDRYGDAVPEVQRHRRHRQRAAAATGSPSRAASRAATRPPTTARCGRRCRRSRCSIRTATSKPASCRSTRGSRPTSLPKVDVSISGTFTSKPGIQVSGFGTPVAGGAFAANYTVLECGRCSRSWAARCRAAQTNITVNLIEPHSILGERVNELNMRVGKIFRIRSSSRQRRRGLLQPAERGDAAQLQPGVHSQWPVADADVGAVSAVHEDHARSWISKDGVNQNSKRKTQTIDCA